MKTINVTDLNNVEALEELCIAIGNFDGLHLGHQKLIQETFNNNLKTAVLTFSPHPNSFIKSIPNYKMLTPIDMKTKLLKSFGIDYLVVVEFNKLTCKVDKNTFINFLKKLNVKKVICGHDFKFANKALGSVKDLEKEFEVTVVPKFEIDDTRVSTTHIKELMEDGQLEKANSFLGRNYSIIGTVEQGNQVGRLLGFPTANLKITDAFLPKNGVYFTKVIINRKNYFAMTNIGYNPTLNYSEERKLETHIIDFDGDLYGKKIEVIFIKRIRNEMKFSSKKLLIKQLTHDKEECLKLVFLKNYKTY
ncbi:MAG: bifunctional riboflavin kinase/FAD synthetase [Anaeroplasmataceae bacterium]